MLDKTCPKCGKRFALADARLDDHWNRWSFKPAYCYCPHCGERLDGVHFDSVELARRLTARNLAWAAFFLAAALAGLLSGTLDYVGPCWSAVSVSGSPAAHRCAITASSAGCWSLPLRLCSMS
jgi:hypothetical protein